MDKSTVIYAIVNKINGHQYIGSAVDFESRKRIHLHHLRNQKHHSRYLQNAYNKYGEENFEFVVLCHCKKDNLLEKEQVFIDSKKPEYNISPTSKNSLGIKRTEETRKRVSEALARAWENPELVSRQSKSHKGYKPSPNQRKKISAALIGHGVSDETKRKISKKQRGIPKSEESKRRMRDAIRKRRPQTEETKRRISETRKKRYGKTQGG